ncbi:hypothetical protein J3Q64DRAFT_1748473 [Phycomyces blakesleeanus]|uniref:Uncharacterized protein n=2 Tax=Phycomyces blakesleeanus TaxID=4837 RepID=A0A167MSD6_PHYB8|nr:hypothetical protein PHYBLDRAFT_186924 [Phycomyces blakesleeanus NRRL 1555(-)]OAD73779.1 hypothetical protein PHYBLDRAFT_186924 [Phycomyces blakesleeanus NRRL 1555(-)]|eukprot:XP_018291819.1 hypothetical protein PHYBLDRAFT_186924 [Phycomyces blakesleeanus NRRL 1555(-)]
MQPSVSTDRHRRSRPDRFNLLYQKYIHAIIRSIDYDKMPEYLKHVAQTHDETKAAQQQMQDYIQDNLEATCEHLKLKYQLPEKIADLERLIKDAREQGDQAQGQMIIPQSERVRRALAIELKRRELSRLQAAKEQIIQESKTTMERISEKKRNVRALHNRLEQDMRCFDEAINMAGSIQVDRLISTMDSLVVSTPFGETV